ncbi:MAG: hypothetical protein ICV83_07495 [Cytophagales bacterium]|nr:hypothetical protein [Cytophagales bacterium]
MNSSVEVSDFSLFELTAEAPSRRFGLSQAGDKVSIHRLILVSHLSPGAPWLPVLSQLQLRFTYHWTGGETQSVLLHPLLWVSPVQLHPVFPGFEVPVTQTMGFGLQTNRRIEQVVIELVLNAELAGEESPVLQVAYKSSPSLMLTQD